MSEARDDFVGDLLLWDFAPTDLKLGGLIILHPHVGYFYQLYWYLHIISVLQNILFLTDIEEVLFLRYDMEKQTGSCVVGNVQFAWLDKYFIVFDSQSELDLVGIDE